MARTYLMMVAVLGLLGSLLSGAGTKPGVPEDRAAEQTDRLLIPGAVANDDPAAPQDGVVLGREPDGHFYADVEINGMPIRVLVDTGASGIALTRDDAQRAGLPVSAGMFDVVGKGADGDVRGEFVTLDKVSLGGETAEQVPAVVLDAGEQSLLGQSFLQQFDRVEIKGDTMLLR